MRMLSLRVLKESGKRKLFVVPYLFTFGNAFFGFLAVTNVFQGNYSAAAYCVVLAALMDMCDGRIARALKTSSYLGMELDSLSDAISFCFAPAVLVYTLLQDKVGLLSVIVPGIYLCAGLLRLARFNQLSAKGVQPFFSGMPTPIAALFIVQLVIHRAWLSENFFFFLLQPVVLLIMVMLLSLLMVSKLRYPSFKKVSPSSHVAVAGVALAAGVTLFLFIRGIPSFFFITIAYIMSGFVVELVARARKKAL
jgi:CDP-diacylglycerol---serine O-phosphatidyltransferase